MRYFEIVEVRLTGDGLAPIRVVDARSRITDAAVLVTRKNAIAREDAWDNTLRYIYREVSAC
jgi:hypothetical protein